MPKVRNPYADWELDVIRNVYPTEGPDGCIARGIKRTRAALTEKAHSMGVSLAPGVKAKRQQANALQQNASEQPVLMVERQPWQLPKEYSMASDIFQAALRVAFSAEQ